MSILEQLMEGDANSITNPEDITIDPKTEKEIEESVLPMSMLIESTYVYNERCIFGTLEVYEMANIIGATQVLQEGTDVQESASVVMEGNNQGFFAKIIEKLKQIKDWFVGIIRKIFRRGNEETITIEKHAERIMPEVKKNVAEADSPSDERSKKQYTYSGDFWDSKGDSYYDRIVKELEDILGSCNNFLRQMEEAVSNKGKDYNIDEIAEKTNFLSKSSKEGRGELSTVDAICSHVITVAFGKSFADKQLTEVIQLHYGVGANHDTRKITSKEVNEMENVIKTHTNMRRKGNMAIKSFDSKCKSIETDLTKIKDKCERESTNTGSLHTACTKVLSTVNSISNVYAQVIKARTSAYIKIVKSYDALLSSIAREQKRDTDEAGSQSSQ